MTEKQKNRNYIYSIVLLSIFLCVSFVLNFFGGFNPHSPQNYALYVGQDTEITITGIGATVTSYAIEGTSLPNDTIVQDVVITLPNIDPTNVTLRAKVMLGTNYVTLQGYSQWQLGEDNYYYYEGSLYQNQSVGLCSSITLPDVSLKSDTVYYVNLIVEFIYTDGLTL